MPTLQRLAVARVFFDLRDLVGAGAALTLLLQVADAVEEPELRIDVLSVGSGYWLRLDMRALLSRAILFFVISAASSAVLAVPYLSLQ
jgi:hypothetical protein